MQICQKIMNTSNELTHKNEQGIIKFTRRIQSQFSGLYLARRLKQGSKLKGGQWIEHGWYAKLDKLSGGYEKPSIDCKGCR